MQSLTNIKTMIDQVYNGEVVTELFMDEYSDYSLVDQPVPVQTVEEDEDGYTIRRSDLVDADGNVFGQMVQHVDEENGDKVIRTEYLDLNGNSMSAEEVENRKNGSSNEETTTEDTGEEGGNNEGGNEGDENGEDGGEDNGENGENDDG